MFAENYDEPSQSATVKAFSDFQSPPNATVQSEEVWPENEELIGSQVIYQMSACPNIINRYHKCSDYCSKKWGCKKFRPDQKMIDKKEKLLAKYPIPDGWMEVGDPNTSRYYYWNMQTDEVSWLPPSHPKANVSLSAERLKELNNPKAGKRPVKARKSSQGESDDSKSDQSDNEVTIILECDNARRAGWPNGLRSCMRS